jgi:hypothetical protein
LWEKEIKEDLLESVPYLLKMPSTRIWIDYDDEADVLYISFQKPQHADESERAEGEYHVSWIIEARSWWGLRSSVRRTTRNGDLKKAEVHENVLSSDEGAV